MRHIIIRRPRHVAPFNEPASQLSVLNRPLGEWQRALLARHCKGELAVDSFDEIPTSGEMIVMSDNLWLDEPFLTTFLSAARRGKQPARAAFRADDPAPLQHGLRRLTRSYQPHGDLYLVELWYFPDGVTAQAAPVVVESHAHEVGYHHMPAYLADGGGELRWWLPERSVCAVETWVHLHFANVVLGAFAGAMQTERRSARRPLFRWRARWRAYVEEKPVLASSAYVRKGRDCSIHPSAVFHGPVTLGDRVTVGPGCVVAQSVVGSDVTLAGGNHLHLSVVGDGCFLPHGAGVTSSVLMDGASVGQNAAVSMSIVGRGSYVGPGTTFSTVNLLPEPLAVAAGPHPVEIDTPMLGACVGHNCRVGPGMVIMPGLSIESDVILLPSPERRVIMQDIRYEESDHHATQHGYQHPRLYAREGEHAIDADYEDDNVTETTW